MDARIASIGTWQGLSTPSCSVIHGDHWRSLSTASTMPPTNLVSGPWAPANSKEWHAQGRPAADALHKSASTVPVVMMIGGSPDPGRTDF
jgi:hypothetical protein